MYAWLQCQADVLSGFGVLNEFPVCLALGTMFISRHQLSALSLSLYLSLCLSLFSAVSLRPIDCIEHPAFGSLRKERDIEAGTNGTRKSDRMMEEEKEGVLLTHTARERVD